MSRKKKWVFAGIIMAIFVIAIIFVLVGAKRRSKDMRNVSQNRTQTTQIKKMDLSTSISVTGTVASADNRSVSTEVAGVQVTGVNVSVGDYVNEGDIIITLDATDLEEELDSLQDSYELAVTKNNKSVQDAADGITRAKEEYTDGVDDQTKLVEEALGNYTEASASEAKLKESYEKAVEATKKAKKNYKKQKEKKSELKTELQKAEKKNSEAQRALSDALAEYEKAQMTAKDENGNVNEQIYNAYLAADAAAKGAQAEYNKAKTAYDAISQAKAAYQEAQSAEAKALEEYNNAVKESSKKYGEYEDSLKSQEETNKKNAENIEDSQYNYTVTAKESADNLKTQKKQVQKAEEKLDKCVITAPISGVITSLSVEAGQTYEGGEMFVVQDMEHFVVEATVDEYDISDIAKDMEAVIKTDATGDEELAGVVTYVAPTPESSTNAGSMGNTSSSAEYKIQITLTDKNDRLRVGMTAKTSIVQKSAKDILAVPYDYVQTDREGNSYIEIFGNNRTDTTKIVVEKGMESDYYVEIVSDEIYEGMQVIAPTEMTGATDVSDKEMITPFGEMPMPGGNMPSGGMPSSGMPGGNRGSGNGGGPMGF